MTGRDRRALLIGASVVAVAVVFTWVGRPTLAHYRTLRDEVARERDLLTRERALLAAAPRLADLEAVLEAELVEVESQLFPGHDALAASAALASYVGTVARRHRVHVQQGETRPSVSALGGLTAVEVGFRAAGDLEGVMALLSELETAARVVEVPRLGIERTIGLQSTEPSRETLALAFVVRGFADVAVPEVP